MANAKKKKPVPAGKSPKPRGLSLRKVVAQITPDDRYPEIPTGPARGREVIDYGEQYKAVAKP